MRILKWIIGIIVVLAVIGVGGAYLKPREIGLDRTVTINASPEEIFPYINNLSANEQWSPWISIDPDIELTYNAIPEGKGAVMSWTSDHENVGNGSMEIVASVPGEHVETALDFGPMGTAVATFDLTEKGGATDVTWGFTSDMGMNPIARWMGPMIENYVGQDYEKGLASLKALVEG